jgi:hypothetical protein
MKKMNGKYILIVAIISLGVAVNLFVSLNYFHAAPYTLSHGYSSVSSARSEHISVKRAPIGEAPLEIRQAWIGVTLPTLESGFPQTTTGYGVLTKSPCVIHGYKVNGRLAVETLARTNPAAAQWWRNNDPQVLEDGRYLIFPVECCTPEATPPARPLLFN